MVYKTTQQDIEEYIQKTIKNRGKGRTDILMKAIENGNLTMTQFFELLYEYEKGNVSKSYIAKILNVKLPSFKRFMDTIFPKKYENMYIEWKTTIEKADYLVRTEKEDGKLKIITPFRDLEPIFKNWFENAKSTYEDYEAELNKAFWFIKKHPRQWTLEDVEKFLEFRRDLAIKNSLKKLENHIERLKNMGMTELQLKREIESLKNKDVQGNIYKTYTAIRQLMRKLGKNYIAEQLSTAHSKEKEKQVESSKDNISDLVKEIESYDEFMRKIRKLYRTFISYAKTLDEQLQLKFIFLVKMQLGVRTGDRKNNHDVFGMKFRFGSAGRKSESYIFIKEGKIKEMHVVSKRNKKYDIYPEDMTEELRQVILQLSEYRKDGDYVVTIPKARVLRYMRKAGMESGFPKIAKMVNPLHFLRKVFLTSMVFNKIPLDLAVEFGVGWTDVNTAKKFYELVFKSMREMYKDVIEGFKQAVSIEMV